MIEKFIYFYGNHETLFFNCIMVLFLIVLLLCLIFQKDVLDVFITLFFLSLFSVIYIVLHCDVIMPMYGKIDKKINPCKYPIEYKFYYEYIDLNGNIGNFVSDNNSACDINYSTYEMKCYYNNTHIRVSSYTYEEEYIYANGCDKE